MPELATALPGWLPSFLRSRRWFGGKGRSIAQCTVIDIFQLDAAGTLALAICGVSYSEGAPEIYAVTVEQSGDSLEGADDSEAIRLLLRAFDAGEILASACGGHIEPADISAEAVRGWRREPPAVGMLGAEQSNTSARVGHSWIFKLFRRLEPGENPEVEMGRFLAARTAFRSMPPLQGSLTYRSPAGSAHTLGVLEGWIESESDGWNWALHALSGGSSDDVDRLRLDLESLGRTTAEFHAALETDGVAEAFKPERVSSNDVASWTAAVRDQAARALTLVDKASATWPVATQRLAAEIRPLLAAGPGEPPPAAEFDKIRIHGDFHLGQTLKTPHGFVIIDFEGEPARELAWRRRKSCALKDVAGMLRSFDYAIESVAGGDPELAWRLRLNCNPRAAFLDSYLATAGALGSRSIPTDAAGVGGWLKFFELEKAFYELEYEINNRPDWIAIPLRGILAVLSS